MFHILVWGAWSFVWGAKPTKAPPWRRDWAGDEGFVGSFARSRTFLGTQQKSFGLRPTFFNPSLLLKDTGGASMKNEMFFGGKILYRGTF